MNGASPSPLAGFIPILFIIGIFYFLVIRPQQKQMKEQRRMLELLKKGDRILTGGGVYGTIVSLRGPDLELKIADNVKVLVTRSSVSKLANHPELASDGGPKDG
ncbi:MAG: preprotein translocase subunit YajC [Elusimicrobiota bacterium]